MLMSSILKSCNTVKNGLIEQTETFILHQTIKILPYLQYIYNDYTHSNTNN